MPKVRNDLVSHCTHLCLPLLPSPSFEDCIFRYTMLFQCIWFTLAEGNKSFKRPLPQHNKINKIYSVEFCNFFLHLQNSSSIVNEMQLCTIIRMKKKQYHTQQELLILKHISRNYTKPFQLWISLILASYMLLSSNDELWWWHNYSIQYL